MIYLAAPYSHPDQAVKDARMKFFYECDAGLITAGLHTISPLSKVETCKHGNVPDDWEYWKDYSIALLKMCDRMIVLAFDGWEQSVGVQAEIAYCNEHNIPIKIITVSNEELLSTNG